MHLKVVPSRSVERDKARDFVGSCDAPPALSNPSGIADILSRRWTSTTTDRQHLPRRGISFATPPPFDSRAFPSLTTSTKAQASRLARCKRRCQVMAVNRLSYHGAGAAPRHERQQPRKTSSTDGIAIFAAHGTSRRIGRAAWRSPSRCRVRIFWRMAW